MAAALKVESVESLERVAAAAAANGAGILKEDKATDTDTASTPTDVPNLYWMVKPCFQYKEEYQDCKSIRARLHQYFIHGEISECSQWKTDFDNCTKWEDHQDKQALKHVVESEKSRIRERLKGHLENDVWESRKEPPADWNKELPKEISSHYENSFLKIKAEEIKAGTTTLGDVNKNISEAKYFDVESSGTMCSIV